LSYGRRLYFETLFFAIDEAGSLELTRPLKLLRERRDDIPVGARKSIFQFKDHASLLSIQGVG
jgi:hypothetical protein